MRCLLFSGLLIFGIATTLGLDATVKTAFAQTQCPTVTTIGQNRIHVEHDTAVCTTGNLGNVTNGIQIQLNNSNIGTDNQIFAITPALGFVNANSLTCPGATIQNAFTIVFNGAGASCNLTAIFNAPTFTEQVVATGVLSCDGNTGNSCTLSNFQVTGAGFSAAARVVPAPANIASATNALFNSFIQVDGGIFDADGPPIAGNRATGNGLTFMPTALSLRPAPQSDDPFYRQYGGVPVGGRQQSDEVTTNAGFDFRLDLNGLRNQARVRLTDPSLSEVQTLADSTSANINLAGRDRKHSYTNWKSSMKDTRAVHEPRFNAWASGRYVDFDDDQRNADRSGHIWRVTSGMSYRVGERTKLGAFGRIRKGEVDSTALQSSLDSDFYGGGLFGIFRTDGGARLLLSGLYEMSDSDIVSQGVTGSFDADQWTVEAIIDKRFKMDRSWIEPSAKVFYTEVDRDGFLDSAGIQVAGSMLTLGRFTAGPKVGTTITGGGKRIAEIRPYAKFAGVWDFKSEGDFLLSTGAVFATSDSGLKVGGGLEVEFVRGTTLTFAGDWFGTNSELEGWSVTGALGTSLAALGLGNMAPTSSLSLDLAASAQGQSAKAKVAFALN